ncbi:MAG TPA: S53 family peptidase [Candidatus Bathyarchaeia archaeon]|nr:S53 family peptidase [Candidatus Bathyarchaeia archaeon]
MAVRNPRSRIRLFAIVASLLVLTLTSAAFAANTLVVANSTPRFAKSAQNLGPEDPSKVISITVHLQLRNRAERDALLKQLYTPGNPQYHQWMTVEEYAARFGPTAQQAAVVQDFLKSNGLAVTSTHANNFYVNAQGTIADVQKAFNVQINRFMVNGKITFANTSDIAVASPAGAFIQSVQGIHPVAMKPRSVRPIDPETGLPFPEVPLSKISNAVAPSLSSSPQPSLFYENQCYRGVESHSFTTSGNLPIGVYSGNRYGGPINGGQGHYPPCGYEPNAMQIAYGMAPLISTGLDGTGQSVVIVDAFGSPTAAADFGVFSSTFGLPTGNFSVYSPQGTPPYNSGWVGETTLDIEWAHSMAPGAGIALIQAIDNYDNNLMGAIQYALDNHLGNTISNSYGGDEYDDDAANMTAWDDLNAEAAALGVSVHYSTGDDGDFYRQVGAYTVSVPSNSPHATAIGGTSDFINANYSLKFQAGWGTDLTRIANPNGTNPPNVPPVCASNLQPVGYCFYFGAGGGESQFFAKPSWQSSLPGTGRWQPDISMTADPYTGVEIIFSYSHPGTYSVSVIGGTSASCPMFSGVWAVVNQKSQQVHGKPAGQAAPYLYSLPAGAIHDVKQASAYSSKNLSGIIMQSGLPPLYESPVGLVGPDINTSFTSAFYQGTSTRWYTISFGTDSSLLVTDGWDDVTGVGTPNGANFVNAVVSKVH